MALKIGRVGNSIALGDPQRWQADGELVHLSGIINPGSVANALIQRDLMLGLANNFDEEVVPVIVDAETRLTGFYRPKGIQIDTDPTAVAKGILGYRLDMERVTDFSNPLFEQIFTGAIMSNAIGISSSADADGFGAVPAAAVETSLGSTLYTRNTATGNVDLALISYVTTAKYYCPPANYYDGAAVLEMGSPYVVWHGRQIPADATNWRVSNGLVRVTGGNGMLSIVVYNGTSWGTNIVNVEVFQGAPVITKFNNIACLRNSPEEVVIRLGCQLGTPNNAPVYLDVSVRRGDVMARCYVTSLSAAAYTVGSNFNIASTVVVDTAHNVGVRATNNDADGNRFFLASDKYAGTYSTTSGRFAQNAAQTDCDFGIGFEIAGSASVMPNTAAEMGRMYAVGQQEKQQVVSR